MCKTLSDVSAMQLQIQKIFVPLPRTPKETPPLLKLYRNFYRNRMILTGIFTGIDFTDEKKPYKTVGSIWLSM